MILEAITKLSVELEEEFRFMPLIQNLEDSATPKSQLITTLSLINAIIDSIPVLNDRFQVRMEFMAMGFKEILANLPSSYLFDLQKSTFEQETENDYEDMIITKQASSHAKVRGIIYTHATKLIFNEF
jgi:hypothetical protein